MVEGYKRAIDEIRGPIAKNGFSGQNPARWPENGLLSGHMALFWASLHGIACFYDVGFGAWAVSRKTPIYFIIIITIIAIIIILMIIITIIP